jgi:hypothetical protein
VKPFQWVFGGLRRKSGQISTNRWKLLVIRSDKDTHDRENLMKALVLSVVLAAAPVAAQDYPDYRPLDPVVQDGYGLGVNRDGAGRPTRYRHGDGTRMDPISRVKRDAYGLGVHSDQYGRPVYDTPENR